MKDFNYESSNNRLQKHVNNIKDMFELAIKFRIVNGSTKNKSGKEYINGLYAKKSLITSQNLIFQLHEFVKEEFEFYGINKNNIFPHLKERKNETKISGFFKQKDQDVCIIPNSIKNNEEKISWGILSSSNKITKYGHDKENKILATNVRSQLSSLSKNSDTLMERMIAEALNIHIEYPKLILGELYLIPVYEYDDDKMKENTIGFKKRQTNLEKYIRFFYFLNNYEYNIKKPEYYKYDYAGLIIADFNQPKPIIYKNTKELIDAGLVNKDFDIELEDLSPVKYAYKLLKKYDKIWGINTLK